MFIFLKRKICLFAPRLFWPNVPDFSVKCVVLTISARPHSQAHISGFSDLSSCLPWKKGDVMCCSIEPICSFSLLVLKSWETLIFGRVSQLKHIYLSDPVLPLVSLIILLFQPVIWHQIKEKLITMLSNYPVLPEHANWCVYICMQISIQTADICIGCTLLDVDEVMFNMNISKTIKRWKPKFFTGGSRHQNKPESVILDRSKILAS